MSQKKSTIEIVGLIIAVLGLLLALLQYLYPFNPVGDSPFSGNNDSEVVSNDEEITPLLPLLSKGNVTIQESGTEYVSLSEGEIVIGTADKYQDQLDEDNPTFTIFVIYGPLESNISLWWGGWDKWQNASPEFVDEQITTKIEEVKQSHPNDFQARGYRVIKCYGQITNCEVVSTYP